MCERGCSVNETMFASCIYDWHGNCTDEAEPYFVRYESTIAVAVYGSYVVLRIVDDKVVYAYCVVKPTIRVEAEVGYGRLTLTMHVVTLVPCADVEGMRDRA